MKAFHFIPCCLLIAGLCSPIAASAQIKPAADAPQPLSPEESAKRIRLPKGFRIELVASEPVVKEPSGIAFDERGRVFVCELHGYNIEGHIDTQELNKTGKLDTTVRRVRWEFKGGKIAEEAAKRQFGVVKLLEDTDGDGVMDKSAVWADDLPPCYGLVPARGGVIVACAPHIMFFADRDGDGKPEVREKLFTGFRVDTIERGINNPIWGLDDWIYVGSGGGGGTITGLRLKGSVELGSSDFRIKADGSAIEPVNGRVGTFGLTMNDVGDRFPSTGGNPAIFALPLPYHYLARNPYVPTPGTNHGAANYGRGYRISEPHPWRVKRGKDPAWVKFYGARETNSNYFSGGCSTTYYGGALFPPEYRGNLFYCEPSLNIVHRTILTRDGAGYRAQRAPGEEESEFLASTDQWFRPMNLRVGPEGALYIVDMYREIIEDYSAVPRFLQQQYGLDKGKDHGRIWRLLPHGTKPRAIPDFSKARTEELARATGDANPWRRTTAQRLLVESQDRAARGALAKLVRAEDSLPAGVIRALYTLDGLGDLQPADVVSALEHPNYGVRLHGLRLGGRWLDSEESLRTRLIQMADDTDPGVRLQVAMTLGDSGKDWAVEGLLKLARKHGDERWMSSAILSSTNNGNGGRVLRELLRGADLGKGGRVLLEPLATTIAGRRDGGDMAAALTLIASLDAEIQKACLSGFFAGVSHGDAPVPESMDGWAPLARFLNSGDAQVRELATKLAAKLPMADSDRLAAMFSDAAKMALEEKSAIAERQQAIQLLANAPFDTMAPVASQLVAAKQAPALQAAAIAALGASADARCADTLLKSWPGLTPRSRNAVLDVIFARTNRLPALLDAIEKGVVHRGDLSAVQKEQLTSNRDPQMAVRANLLFKDTTTEAELSARIDRYQKALAGKRDQSNGKAVYEKNCIVCHKLGEQGNDVGPSLGSITGKPDEAILLDILDPSGKIEPEYKLYLVSAAGGKSYAGVLASESPTSVTLNRADGGSDVVLRQDISRMTASEVSLMPANLHTQISPQDAADLIAFLRATFKDGPGRK